MPKKWVLFRGGPEMKGYWREVTVPEFKRGQIPPPPEGPLTTLNGEPLITRAELVERRREERRRLPGEE